jgi:hypothetical protein
MVPAILFGYHHIKLVCSKRSLLYRHVDQSVSISAFTLIICYFVSIQLIWLYIKPAWHNQKELADQSQNTGTLQSTNTATSTANVKMEIENFSLAEEECCQILLDPRRIEVV